MNGIWRRYLASLLVFTMVLNGTGTTVLAETIKSGLAAHALHESRIQNLTRATDSDQKNKVREASESDAAPLDSDMELLDDISTPSNAILAIGFSEEDADLQYQQGHAEMSLEDITFPETMVLTLMDLETGEEYQTDAPVTWRLVQPVEQNLLSDSWIFIPVLENPGGYDWSLLPVGYASWDAYLKETAGIYVQINMDTLAGTGENPLVRVKYGDDLLTPGEEAGWYRDLNGKVTVENVESAEGVTIETSITVTAPSKETEEYTLGDQTKHVEISLDEDGIWKIQTESTRTGGAQETEYTADYTVRVDTVRPVIVAAAEEGTWTNKGRTVTFTVTDPTASAEDGKVSGVNLETVTVTGPDNDHVTVDTPDAENSNYKFTATQNGIYTVNAKDAAGNAAESVQVNITRIDTTKPDNIKDDNVKVSGNRVEESDWYREISAISIDKPQDDDGAPLAVWWRLEYKATDKEAGNYELVGRDTQYGDATADNNGIPKLNKDGVYRLTVWVKDEAGNRSDKTSDVVRVIKVDTQAPEPVEGGIIIKPTGDTPLEKIGNFLSFGNFFKEELEVTVTAEDATSGTLCLYSDVSVVTDFLPTNINRKEMESGKASFKIPFPISSGVRYAKFMLGDKAGNISEIFFVRGKKESEKWILETEAPEITNFEADRTPDNGNDWYNGSVTFTAKVTDTRSFLNKVDWIVTDDSGAEQKTHLFTRPEDAESGISEYAVTQTITADGEITADICAWDNAMNESRLSSTEPLVVRTVKIDTQAPVIQYVSGNPADWTAEEQTITFTVTDTPKTEGIRHSGVDDDSVKVSFVKSAENQEAENGELELLSRTPSGDGSTWTYTFRTRGNGTYTFNAKDIAGNAADAVTITVNKINSTELEAPGTDEKGNRGYVKWNEHTGKDYKESSESVIGWYANSKNPEITIRNSDAGPNDMPIYTVYKLWNTAKDTEPETFTRIGYESNLYPKTAIITEDVTWTDGTWKLAAWNTLATSAAGNEALKAEWTFMVDNNAPVVSETPEELKEINTDGWQKVINKLSFGLFYKEAIQVTVQVEDATSHGETLYYQIETEKDGKKKLLTGNTEIKLEDEDSTIGKAKFTLPIGTKGKIAMWAEDFAGNVSAQADEAGNLLPDSNGQVYLGYNGTAWWELENTAPVITEISPAMNEKDVSIYLKEVVLTFDERVTAAEGKTVTISTGSEYYDYTLAKEDTDRIYLASPANADMGMSALENVHGIYQIALPVDKFIERITGESLSFCYNTVYTIQAEMGAFLDLASNEQTGGIYSVFKIEDGYSGDNGGNEPSVVNTGTQAVYHGGIWQNDGWRFVKSDGTKPHNEWLTIDGKIYRFGSDGFMKTSFENYQFDNDGSLTAASAELVKTQAPVASGGWLRDGWSYKMNNNKLSAGWYYLYYNGLYEWYYFNEEGWMLDGWLTDGGDTYYLHTARDGSRGRMYTGWQIINGNWYYFRMKADGKEGALMRNSYTPDGYFVDANGVWDGKGITPVASVRK